MKKKCNCEKSCATYEIIGEDLWFLTLTGGFLTKGTVLTSIKCGFCGHEYDTFDSSMVIYSKENEL